MNPEPTLLVVEDDAEMRAFLEEELREAGYQVTTAADGSEALVHLRRREPDLVVTDLMMPGMKGSDLLRRIRSEHPGVPVVIITAFGSVESAVEEVKAGAFHYLAKPFRTEQLLDVLRIALEERKALRLQRGPQAGGEDTWIAESPAMQRVVELALRASAVDSPILLLGESGTGKEVLARLVHRESPRRDRPFVPVNCAAIPEGLLESHLFGHRRGSFTDAREDRAGLFLEAAGGTVFLDEIGDMPLALQAKILRAIENREVHPVGAPAPVPTDVRLLAATHRDLKAEVVAGRFREDLLYRLNVITIRIPPLRERREDIVSLLAHFLDRLRDRLNRPDSTFSSAAFDRLRRYDWPGNVRELENVVERCLVLARQPVIDVSDLPEELRSAPVPADDPGEMLPMHEVERQHILRTLRLAGGNKAEAARMLGLDRKTLYRKLTLYRLADRDEESGGP